MYISKKIMYKSKETRKALLDIVAMHDPDRVKQLLALMQPILSCPGMSTSKSCSRIREVIYENRWSPTEKIHKPTKTDLKRTLMCCFII